MKAIKRSKKSFQSRRQFITKAAASAAVVTLGAPSILQALNNNEKLDIAIIGVGGRGGANTNGVKSENIVALCDVNENHLARVGKQYSKAKKFVDFRKLYEKTNHIDAVVVSTCEHTHALATLPALQMKKHVYCEKPLTHNVYEARVIREAAMKAGVATQMGTQIHAGDNYRRVVELIQGGSIGQVSEVHTWVGRAWGWQSAAQAKKAHDIVSVREKPSKKDPIPKGLNWDLWLGPAPERAFNNVYFPGPKWYRWWDFGNGTMSDLGSHWVDLPFWALNLNHPKTIEASGPPAHPEIAPASMKVTYEYGARGTRSALKLHWYQGTEKPEILKRENLPRWGSGVLFVGSKGMVLSDYFKHTLLPEKKFKDFHRPDQAIPKSIGHYKEWIHACKTGAPTTCNFDYAGWLTEANHLGNVAYRIGKKIEWDHVNLKAKNAPEAEPLIQRPYRKGWKLV